MKSKVKDAIVLKKKSAELRLMVLDTIYAAGRGHIGGAFSMMDILTVLFYGGALKHDPTNPEWDERDIFLLSKGHAGVGLYCALADCGYFPVEQLGRLNQGGMLGEHPDRNIPGVEILGGSLGHAVGVASGIAKSDQIDNKNRHVIVLMGDGECYEGSVWEAVLFASHHRLQNLAVIIDRNGLIATGASEQVNTLGSLADKLVAFGWMVVEVDGHDVVAIQSLLKTWKSDCTTQPIAIIAQTVKGKGVTFMENQVGWHHGVLNESSYKVARQELVSYLRGLD
jgi:transketolase